MYSQVEAILTQCFEEYNALAEEKIDYYKEDAKLFGDNGPLDSIGLVTLIVSIEQAIDDEFGKSIILADEKAFSQIHSPFSTTQRLINYIVALLKEEG